MAQLQGGIDRFPQTPNILGAIQTGANISQNRQANQFAREKYETELGQLAVENKRVEEDRAFKSSEQDYNKGVREVQIGKSYNDVGIMETGFRRSMTALGMDVPEDFPIEQQTYDRFIKVANEKKPELQNEMEEQFAGDFGLSVSAFAQRAKGVGADVTAFETGQAAEATTAGEERKLQGQERLETFKTDEAIRQEQAKITATAGAKGIIAAKPDNITYIDPATKTRSTVNVNDPLQKQAAELLGLEPLEGEPKDKEAKPIFLQGKLESGGLDTVTIDKNDKDAVKQIARFLKFGYSPVKDPDDPTVRFGLQTIKTPAGGPPAPVNPVQPAAENTIDGRQIELQSIKQPTAQDLAVQDGINEGLSRGRIPKGLNITLETIRKKNKSKITVSEFIDDLIANNPSIIDADGNINKSERAEILKLYREATK